jgi:hypothetical protein
MSEETYKQILPAVGWKCFVGRIGAEDKYHCEELPVVGWVIIEWTDGMVEVRTEVDMLVWTDDDSCNCTRFIEVSRKYQGVAKLIAPGQELDRKSLEKETRDDDQHAKKCKIDRGKILKALKQNVNRPLSVSELCQKTKIEDREMRLRLMGMEKRGEVEQHPFQTEDGLGCYTLKEKEELFA